MTDDALRRAYARHLSEREGTGREHCALPEALLAVVERRGDEETRLATLDHVGGCAACAHDLDLLRAVHRAGPRSEAPRWRAWVPRSGGQWAAAAALVITVGLVATRTRGASDAVMRGDATALRLISPAAAAPASQPVALTWHALPDAVRYDVELLRVNGDSLFAAMTPDTTLVVPPSVVLAADAEYLWTVRAELRDGTHAATSLRFRVRQP
jgi:hypothetical protein